MKKLYSLIFAFLLCVCGVSAQSLGEMTTPNRLKHNAPAAALKAPATATVTDEWTEWENFGTGTFTIDEMFDEFLGTEYEGSYPGIVVDRRVNIANPALQQYRFNGIFNKATIVFDYNDATGQVIVNPQDINLNYFDMDGFALKAVDSATLWTVLGPAAGFSKEDIEVMYDTFASYNYFIPTLGRFYVYFGFFYEGATDAVALSDCQFQFDNYPDFTPSIELAKYVTPAEAKAKVSFCEETAYALYAVSNRPYTQAVLDLILEKGETENMIYKITEPKEISVATSAYNRVNDLVVITFDEKGNALEMNSQMFTVVNEEPGQWTSLGKVGVYVDILEGTVFEKEGNSYEIEVQQNNENKALYRVVDLYGEASPLTKPEHVHTALPHYLVFDTTDPEMVQLAHTDLGIDMGGGSFYVYADATQKLYDGKKPESIKNEGKCGTFKDGVLIFPEGGLQILADDFSVFGGVKGGAYGCGGLQIDLSGLSGIEGVAVDANEPVRYYNLQGMEVQNPSSGIYIRRKGSSTSKIYVK